MHRIRLRVVASAALAALLYGPSPALAQTAPALGAAQSFAVLAGSTITNTGSSVITGDLGLSPGTSVTGFPPGTVSGTAQVANAAALAAKSALTTAYNDLAGRPCGTDLTGQDLGGLTLTAGVYCFSSSAQLTGNLTLNPAGNANAVFIFKIGSTLTTAAGSSVTITGPGSACNVFWQVGSSATLGAGTTFRGNILALSSITGVTAASVQGRTLARNGAVTLDTNAVDASLCAAAPPASIPPTLDKAFSPNSITQGGVSTLTITLTNPNATVATLSAAFTDTLPSGVVIAATPNASTTCTGTGAVSATAGGSTVTLPATRTIPVGDCTVTANVSAALAGTYVNTLAAGALQTNHGNNATSASATLTAIPAVPTLPEWALIALVALLGLTGVLAMRRRAI